MAAVDSDFEEQDSKFSLTADDLGYAENEFNHENTNVLTLDDSRPAGSVMSDNMTAEEELEEGRDSQMMKSGSASEADEVVGLDEQVALYVLQYFSFTNVEPFDAVLLKCVQ